jgi:hypothetical protein
MPDVFTQHIFQTLTEASFSNRTLLTVSALHPNSSGLLDCLFNIVLPSDSPSECAAKTSITGEGPSQPLLGCNTSEYLGPSTRPRFPPLLWLLDRASNHGLQWSPGRLFAPECTVGHADNARRGLGQEESRHGFPRQVPEDSESCASIRARGRRVADHATGRKTPGPRPWVCCGRRPSPKPSYSQRRR